MCIDSCVGSMWHVVFVNGCNNDLLPFESDEHVILPFGPFELRLAGEVRAIPRVLDQQILH